MENLLISACLLGGRCKYNGGHNALPAETLSLLRTRYRLIPVCPEVMGGLSIPRSPCERRGNAVVSRDGRDLSSAFFSGAEQALKLARRYRCKKALLKERSPSCGAGEIYDGSFSGNAIPGDGICAKYLSDEGLLLFGESRWKALLSMDK